MPTLQMTSVRVEEHQLLELGARAKRQPTKQGFLHKCDGKGKHCQKRWCCLYRNFLFTYETEMCTKPSCLFLLEGCLCKAGEGGEVMFGYVYQALSSRGAIYLFIYIFIEIFSQRILCKNSFTLAYEEDSPSKGCVFFAKSAEDRDEWVTCINNSK